MVADVSILGFGQCGSKVAVEVSASLNPAKILSGEAPMSFSIKYLRDMVFSPKVTQSYSGARYFIADLNASNDVYTFFSKAQLIQRYIEDLKSLSAKEIIERINKKKPTILLDESDIDLVDKVKQSVASFKNIQALYFEANNRPLLEMGGAGGLQYLSEIIAEQDERIVSSIDQTQRGALIGIFSLGGGTGSGSLFSILSQYRKKNSRYTIGVGILPERENIAQLSNSGRYFVKFLGSGVSDRFHTLFLFSNETARDAIKRAGQKKADELPLNLVNQYISSFIRTFSLINDHNTETIHGKLFDPMDAKRFLSGICSVGYATSKSTFNALELFSEAMSPLRCDNSALRGIAVRVTRPIDYSEQAEGIEPVVRIAELVSEIVKKLADGVSAEQSVEELKRLTPFYRTIKAAKVFLFVHNKGLVNAAHDFQACIIKFFKSLAGGDLSIDVNVYYSPEKQENTMLILLNGAFSFEIYEGVMRYTKDAFSKKTRATCPVDEAYGKLLISVRRKHLDDAEVEISQEMEKILSDNNCEFIERTIGKENVDLFENNLLKRIVTPDKLDKILIRRASLRKALEEVARNFCLGERPQTSKDEIFDEW